MIDLRPIEETDIPDLARWLNDPNITHYMFYGQKPMNLAQTRTMILDQVMASNNTVFLIVDRKSVPVGFCGLYDIHASARQAAFRILIGEPSHWKKGIGTEVTELLTWYGFDRLNLHRIWLGVTSGNTGAIKAYEKAGYTVEGTLRDDLYRNGRYYDSIRMAILRPEYEEKFSQAYQARFGKKR